MKTKATFLGHPIHQMMIVLPLGLLATSAAFDLYGSATRNRRLLRSSHSMLKAGVITRVGSAVPGAVDFFSIPSSTRAQRIGLLHGLGNLLVTGLFAASWFKTRRSPTRRSNQALSLSTAGAALALVTEWLGGELVDTLGIGVHEDADVNAPNSLSRTRRRSDASTHVTSSSSQRAIG